MFGRSKCAAKLSWYCLQSCRTVKKGANLPIVLKKVLSPSYVKCKFAQTLAQGCLGQQLRVSSRIAQEVEGLGPAGEHVRVNPGFAHNWLLPKRLAIYDIAANHGGRRSRTTQVLPYSNCLRGIVRPASSLLTLAAAGCKDGPARQRRYSDCRATPA